MRYMIDYTVRIDVMIIDDANYFINKPPFDSYATNRIICIMRHGNDFLFYGK